MTLRFMGVFVALASFIGTERNSEPKNTQTSPHLRSVMVRVSVMHLKVNEYASEDALYAGTSKTKRPFADVVTSRLKMTP